MKTGLKTDPKPAKHLQVLLWIPPNICNCLNKLALAKAERTTECGSFATYKSWPNAVS